MAKEGGISLIGGVVGCGAVTSEGGGYIGE